MTRDNAVGIVGVGDLGLPIALRLHRQGWRVLAYDRDLAARRRAAAAGIEIVDTMADLAGRVTIASVVVPDDAAALAVTTGLGGLVDVVVPSTIIIHSTLRPSTVVQIGEAARNAGVVVIEAALSGGSVAAEMGELTVMRGGPADGHEGANAVLNSLGDVHHLGGWGAGQVAKLANNLVLGGVRLLVLEALAIGSTRGISEVELLAIMSKSTASCWALDHWDEVEAFCRSCVDRGDAGFLGKDVAAAMELASQVGLEVPVARAVDGSIVTTNIQRATTHAA